MRRRELLIGTAAGLAAFPASAATPFRSDMWPPLNDKAAFVAWGVANRGEEAKYLERRFDRASREGKTDRSIRMTLSLAFLAPDIVKAAIDGRLPRGLGLKRLVDLPMAWSDQWRALGLKAPTRS